MEAKSESPRDDARTTASARTPDDAARFWSGAGLIFGIWVFVAFVSFVLIVSLSSVVEPPPKPLTREEVLAKLGEVLREPSPPLERYKVLLSEIAELQKPNRVADEALLGSLKEAQAFAQQIASPREYWITPLWMEGPMPQGISGLTPHLKVEAVDDASVSGVPTSQPQSAPSNTWQKMAFGKVAPTPIIWSVGEPLRFRFTVSDVYHEVTHVAVGGDDLERAQDAPLPGASILLIGEPRAFTRGQGRYLAQVKTKDGAPVVAPLLLLQALAVE